MAYARLNGGTVTLEYTPRDGQALVQQGLATLVRLAQSTEPRQAKEAFQAALALVEIGERILQQKASKQPEPVKAFQTSRAELLNDLKGLYAKALGTGPALVVEAESAESVPVPDRT